MTQTINGAASAAPAPTWAQRLRASVGRDEMVEVLRGISDQLAALDGVDLPPARIKIEVLFGYQPDKVRNAELRAAVDTLCGLFGLKADKNDSSYGSPMLVLTGGLSVSTWLDKNEHELVRVIAVRDRHQAVCSCKNWSSDWHPSEDAAGVEHDMHARGVERQEIGTEACGCVITAEHRITSESTLDPAWVEGTERTEHLDGCPAYLYEQHLVNGPHTAFYMEFISSWEPTYPHCAGCKTVAVQRNAGSSGDEVDHAHGATYRADRRAWWLHKPGCQGCEDATFEVTKLTVPPVDGQVIGGQAPAADIGVAYAAPERENPETGGPLPSGVEGHRLGRAADTPPTPVEGHPATGRDHDAAEAAEAAQERVPDAPPTPPFGRGSLRPQDIHGHSQIADGQVPA